MHQVNLLEISKETNLSQGLLSTRCDVAWFSILKILYPFPKCSLWATSCYIENGVPFDWSRDPVFLFPSFPFFLAYLHTFWPPVFLPVLGCSLMTHRQMTRFIHWAFSEHLLVLDPCSGKAGGLSRNGDQPPSIRGTWATLVMGTWKEGWGTLWYRQPWESSRRVLHG